MTNANHPIRKAPTWAREQREHERADNRAARVAALYVLLHHGPGLPDVPKTHLAQALGISRWTLDRDLSSVPQVAEHMQAILATIDNA